MGVWGKSSLGRENRQRQWREAGARLVRSRDSKKVRGENGGERSGDGDPVGFGVEN